MCYQGIEESFQDYDLKYSEVNKTTEEPKLSFEKLEQDDDDDDDCIQDDTLINEIISQISPK